MDVSLSDPAALGIEQRDLTTAAQVTESYISPLLTRKKAPPPRTARRVLLVRHPLN